MTAAGLRALAAPVLALLAVVAGGWLFWDAQVRRGAEQAGAQALQSARESIPAILSYQPATADKDLAAAAQDRLTGKFLADYTQLIATVVVPEAKQQGVSASARVPAAAVVSADNTRAVVLAYVNQSLTVGTAAPTQTTSSVRVTMDNVDGRWLISGFDPI
jgi:Mce-associated membrane protein